MNTWIPEKTPVLSELAKTDASSRAFYSCLKRGDDPYSVIEEMAKCYAPILQKQQQTIEKLLLHCPAPFIIEKL